MPAYVRVSARGPDSLSRARMYPETPRLTWYPAASPAAGRRNLGEKHRVDWVMTLAPSLGAGFLRLVRLTSRYRVKGRENLDTIKRGPGRGVWVCWHNRLLGAIALHTSKNIGALISQSRDGELIARTVSRLGYAPLRGSTSRGSSGVLRAAMAHLEGGFDVVFTVDGPRGPRYVVQQGAAFAARNAGVPVLPVGIGATPKFVLRSWDRFQIPLPFSRVQVVYGEPLTFARDESIDQVKRRIGEALTRVTEEADAMLGVVSP